MTAIQDNDNDENNKQNNGYWNEKKKIRKHDFMRYNAIYLSWKVLMHELLLFIFLITIHKNDDADDQNATENKKKINMWSWVLL